MTPLIGVCSYAQRTSGCGAIAYELRFEFPLDAFLAVRTPKGAESWLGPHQQTVSSLSMSRLMEFLTAWQGNFAEPAVDAERGYETIPVAPAPRVLVFIETPFGDQNWEVCRSADVKTALIVMHETYKPGRHRPDLFICPNQFCYDAVEEPNKVLFPWPMQTEPYWFRKLDGQPTRFLHVMGYGSRFDRRQTGTVIRGFMAALEQRPDIKLTVHCQKPLTDYGFETSPHPNISLRMMGGPGYDDPNDVYHEGSPEVLLQPDSYAGLNRVLQEACACGLVPITTAAEPMVELVPWRECLIAPDSSEWMEHGNLNMRRHLVTVDAVRDKVLEACDWDLGPMSLRSRQQAIGYSWTEQRRAEFMKILEGLCTD